MSKHGLGDIVYKPIAKVGDHEYLLPLDGQTLDTTTYKRLTDYLGTATLPDLNGRYLRADSTPGQMVEAGLPNITGDFSNTITDGVNISNGALWQKKTNNYIYGGSEPYGTWTKILFDASRSSSIYGKSTTVTPLTYTVRAYICYA